MKLKEYKSIKSYLNNQQDQPLLKVFNGLIHEFTDYSADVLLSICSFHYQQHTKQTYSMKTSEEKIDEYFEKFKSLLQQKKAIESVDQSSNSDEKYKSVLLTLSEDVGLPPALLARLLLKKNIELQLIPTSTTHVKEELSSMMKNPFRITDQNLSEEIRQCVLHDIGYGSVTDAIRHMVGYEFEQRLYQNLDSLSIPYLNEDDLRKLGYDKTPDVKLEIPISIKGHVVSWIESKASFGVPEAHKTYLNDQYNSYLNRFGSGLVIYWYGFVDELLEDSLKYGILLMDSFPSNSDLELFKPGLD